MTNEDAIKWLDNLRQDIGQIRHSDLWHYEQAIEEITELLKKQKPKDFDLVEQSLFCKLGLCPECGKKLHSGMHPNYCGFCGQAVKWG